MMGLLKTPTDERLFAIYQALRRGVSVEEISKITAIDPYFIRRIENIIKVEDQIKREFNPETLRLAKRMGFTDERIAALVGKTREDVTDYRTALGIIPTYKMVDTCAAEFEAKTPYYYSSYDTECELKPTNNKKVLIIGSGPIRIGQGIEFDYCTVHAVMALRERGIETHIINNNPETVSTDYDTSDRLFFEPVTLEDVMNIIEKEKPYGVMVQFGGQTAVNLAIPLEKRIAGAGLRPRSWNLSRQMDNGKDRERFNALMRASTSTSQTRIASRLKRPRLWQRHRLPVWSAKYVLGGSHGDSLRRGGP
jgi:carbamoyl-phosphate synthase large subunit